MADITTWTDAGLVLLAKWNAGNERIIDSVWVGSGLGESETGLILPVAQATSTVPFHRDNTVNFTVQYRNDLHPEITEAFTLTEYALFAIDPDVGRIMMFRTELVGDGEPVPPISVVHTVRNYPISIAINRHANITLNYIAGAFIDAIDLEDRLNGFNAIGTVELSDADIPEQGVKTHYRISHEIPNYIPIGGLS